MPSLTLIEQKGQRVLTTFQTAEALQTDIKRIHDDFRNNRERFEIGKHYFELKGEELRAFKETYPIFSGKVKHTPIVYLWTEQGVFLLAKSINTDAAWKAYRDLVDDYFDIKQGNKVLPLSKDQAFAQVLRTTADLLDGQAEIRQELQEVRNMVVEQITLDSGDQRKVQKAVANKVYSTAPQDSKERRELFRQLHREIKDRWAVPSYKDVRRAEMAEVLGYIGTWKPRIV